MITLEHKSQGKNMRDDSGQRKLTDQTGLQCTLGNVLIYNTLLNPYNSDHAKNVEADLYFPLPKKSEIFPFDQFDTIFPMFVFRFTAKSVIVF